MAQVYPDYPKCALALGQEALSANGKRLVQVKENGHVRVSEVPSGKRLLQFQCKPEIYPYIAFSPDGRWLGEATLIGSLQDTRPWTMSMRVRDLQTGKVVVEQDHQFGTFFLPVDLVISFSENSRVLRFSANSHQRVQFDIQAGQFTPSSRTSFLTEARSRDEKLAIISVPEEEETPQGKKAGKVKHEYLIMEAIPDSEATATIKPSPIGSFSFPKQHWRSHVFLPSKRILATGSGSTIHLWSIPTGKEIGSFSLPAAARTKTWRENQEHSVNSLACSGDGRLLVSTHFNGTGLVWDLTSFHAKARLGGQVDEDKLERLWSDLKDKDAAKAWKSIWTMSEHAELSVKLLEARLKPEIAPEEKEAARMIRELGSENFKVRQQALKEIRGHDRRVAHFLRSALAQKLDLEMERRLRQLLDQFARTEPFTPERLRQWRALEVLEQINTPAASNLVQSLARGAPEAWLTRQAADVQRRMASKGNASEHGR